MINQNKIKKPSRSLGYLVLGLFCFCGLFSGSLQAQTALVEAILQADTQRVTQLLNSGYEPNEVLADYSTPLAWAVESQNTEMVSLLLEYGANPNPHEAIHGIEQKNFSPLVNACRYANARIVSLLLQAGADVNTPTSDGTSPFALCAGTLDSITLGRMIKLGAEIDKTNSQGQTPLMRAAFAGRNDNIELLLANGANINAQTSRGFTPLFFALKSSTPDTAQILYEAGADIGHYSKDGTSTLQLALYQQKYEFAVMLIKNMGASQQNLTAYDLNGNQPLHAAVLANQSQLVELMLLEGADPNSLTGESKITWRYEVNFTSAPYVVYKKSPILLAAEAGSFEIMRLLVEAGADPDFSTEDGSSLLLAAARSNPECLTYALELQTNANLSNNNGQTALHLLLEIGTDSSLTKGQIVEMLQILAASGANPDIKNNQGKSPTDLVFEYDYLAKTEFLEIFNKKALL